MSTSINPNEEVIRVTIDRLQLMNLKENTTRFPLAATVEYLTYTKTGRNRWVRAAGPVVGITETDGTTNDDCTAAQLLGAVARWCEARETTS